MKIRLNSFLTGVTGQLLTGVMLLSMAAANIDAGEKHPPDLTMYVSFDRYPGMKMDVEQQLPRVSKGPVRCYMPGMKGIYPKVNYSENSQPLLCQWDLIPVEGKFKQAVRLIRTKKHSVPRMVFDAVGNIFPQKGSINFWVRWDIKTSRSYLDYKGTLFSLGTMRLPHKYMEFLEGEFKRGRFCLRLTDRFGKCHELEIMNHNLQLKNKNWYHFSVNWDESKGMKLYVNGKVVKENWGNDSWFSRNNIESLTLGHAFNAGAGGSFAGKKGEYIDFDELYVFKRALDDKEVAELIRKNSPTGFANDKVTDIVSRRREMMGWDNSRNMIKINQNDTTPVTIRQLAPLTAKVLKISTCIPIDGEWHTSWPLEFRSYFKSDSRLEVQFPDSSRFNYVKMIAPSLKGEFTTVKGRKSKTLFDVEPDRNAFQTFEIKGGVKGKEFAVNRDSGKISEIAFYDVFKRKSNAEADSYVITSSGITPLAAPPSGRRLGQFSSATMFADDADRTSLNLTRGTSAPAGGENVKLEAGRFVQLVFPAVNKTTVFTELQLDLKLKTGKAPINMWLGWFEPVLHQRFMWESDWQLNPATGANTRNFRLKLEVPGLAVEKDKRLCLMLMADQPVEIINSGNASKISLVSSDKESALNAYYENQLGFLKDCFRTVSEARTWIWAGEPFNTQRILAGSLANLESLEKLRHEDWRPAGIWNYINDVEVKKGDWQNYKEPQIYKQAEKLPKPPAGVPAWAFWWQQAYRELRKPVDWWIDNRQIDNGEFGGVYSDDTDLVHEWANYHMIYDPGNRLGKSFSKLSDYCWNNWNKDGLSIYRNDSDLHSYEEGMNIHSACMLFYPGDPKYYNRTLIMAQHTDGNLTRINAKGQRLQPCTTYTGHRFDTRGDKVDKGVFHRMEPVMWLTWYNRNPEAVRLLREWMDSRLSYFPSNHPTGLPGAVRFDDGKDLTRPDDYMPSINYQTLYLLKQATGSDKYLEPLIFNLKKTAKGKSLVINYYNPITWKMFSRFDTIGKAPWWPGVESYIEKSGLSAYGSPYKSETRKAVVESLKEIVKTMRQRESIFTWAEQSDDRIFFPAYPRSNFYWMTLGGTARIRTSVPIPDHAVSYENADGDIARWVLQSNFNSLKIAFYNFKDKPVSIRIRPWILEGGSYVISQGIDSKESFRPNAPKTSTVNLVPREDTVAIILPPRKTYIWEASLKKAEPVDYSKPDLAVSSQELELIDFIPSLRIALHNIGRSPARDVKVVVSDADTGKKLWSKTVEYIDWPADLAPKTVDLYTGKLNIDGVKRLKISIDPEHKIKELSRLNNELLISLPDKK